MSASEVFRDFWKIIASWWNTDRIRISPRDGRLFRIMPDDLLTVDGVDLEVLDRTLVIGEECQSLRLDCRSPSGSVTVSVMIQAKPKVFWTNSESSREISAEGVEIWPRSNCARCTN